jgi:hypothetical protein
MANSMLRVERYEAGRHYEALSKWLHFYDLAPIDPAFLPPTGFVVEGIAMGFLVRTDTKLALLEPLVNNGYAPVAEREAATDLVVLAILDEARAQGFRVVEGNTNLQAVVSRALRLGFTLDENRYSVVTFEL